MSRTPELLVLRDPSDIGMGKQMPAYPIQTLGVKLYVGDSSRLIEFMNEDGFESFPAPRAFRISASAIVKDTEGMPDAVSTDNFGDPLRYCYSTAFVDLDLPEDEHPLNHAALEYIRMLPNDWPIIIYWG